MADEVATRPRPTRRGWFRNLMWVLAAFGALLGALMLVFGNGAPSAAIAGALAVIPYVFARACDEIG